MSINPISAQSFKGLWQVKQNSSYDYGVNTIERTFTYYPFADEKVDTLDIQEKTKKIEGKYTCTEYDDCDHQFPHTIENKFAVAEPLKVTAERYSTLVKSIVSQYGKGFKYLEDDQVKELIVPDQIDFGKSKSRFDYSDVKKIG